MAKTVSTPTAAAESLRLRPRMPFLLGSVPARRAVKPYLFVKRGLDLLVALTGLIVFSPVLLIAAIAIKLDSPGPIIFRQARTGKNGKIFYIRKFRTMVKENDVHDKSCQDQCTRVGRFLRDASIDELPQLINIVRGEMSFIGPRPWIPEYYKVMTTRQRGRVKVLPGVTGLAQAKGRNGITIFKKINYDLEYVRNISFRQDIKVFFLTIKVVFTRDAASANKTIIHDELAALRKRNQR